MTPPLDRFSDALACPACAGGELTAAAEELDCRACGARFDHEHGIPLLHWPDVRRTERVTEQVRAFYEANPFPNYDDVDSPERLREKAASGFLAAAIDEQLGRRVRVLEVGCGTGQLCNYLGLRAGRTVVGADVCLSSLRLADGFARRHHIDNVRFLQMNLFRPSLRAGWFDLVICSGVLHHTADPLRGFRAVASLAARDGLVLVGLYNRGGRALTNLRRRLFDATGDRLLFLDPRLREPAHSERKRRTWLLDQYRHPCETQHSFGEVLRWFSTSGVAFVNSVPPAGGAVRPLFASAPPGTPLTRLGRQLAMAAADRDGGLFVMVGRKLADAGAAAGG